MGHGYFNELDALLKIGICPLSFITPLTRHLLEVYYYCWGDFGLTQLPYPALGIMGNPALFFMASTVISEERAKIRESKKVETKKNG